MQRCYPTTWKDDAELREFKASPGYRMSSICACAYTVRLCPMHKTMQQPASCAISIPFNWIVVTVNLDFQLDADES